jgi:hypothetical protein
MIEHEIYEVIFFILDLRMNSPDYVDQVSASIDRPYSDIDGIFNCRLIKVR